MTGFGRGKKTGNGKSGMRGSSLRSERQLRMGNDNGNSNDNDHGKYLIQGSFTTFRMTTIFDGSDLGDALTKTTAIATTTIEHGTRRYV
jgi:hypothetical protein